jgi:glycosyltransferase involved in cell wall biosynthesis
MARNVLARARRLTAVSPIIKDRLATMTTIPIIVIPNPISDNMFRTGALYRLRDPGHAKIVMIINGWSDLKNPKPALAAFSMLRKKHPGWELHCYGSDFGNREQAYKWMSANASVDGVHFHGRRPYADVLGGLSTADVLLHPSRTEACSMAIAEAMSLGIPVIGGSNSGGVPWQLSYGKAGFLTNVESEQAIASTLDTCINGDKITESFRSAVVARAKELFSSSRVAVLYENEYLKALDQPTGQLARKGA